MTAIAISRAIGPVLLDVWIHEKHESQLAITLNPVEKSADVTDHAYSQPKRLTLHVMDGQAAATYQALLRLQASREPFDVVSGLHVYRDVLIEYLDADRDKDFANVLSCTCELLEIIRVGTAHVGVTSDPGTTSLSGENAADADTADRISGTVQHGDSASDAVPAETGQSILFGIYGE